MKTLYELQQELRLIRKDVAKMDERLSKIDEELMSCKDSLQDDTNFQHIYNLAKVMPIIPHPVVTMQQKSKSIYFGILLMIATLEDSVCDQQLLFLQRMVMSDDTRNRIDYYMGSLGKIQPDNVFFCLDDEAIVACANQLLLDMIVVAKLGNNCTTKTYGVIADIASFMGKNKIEFTQICKVAVSVMTRECSCLTEDVIADIELDKEYGHYLRELPIWEKRLQNAIKQADSEKSEKIHFFSSSELLGYGIHLI